MRILGPPVATQATVKANLVKLGAAALFTEQMLPALWAAATKYAIRPEGMVAQAFHETNKGLFGGQVKAQFYNPAGIKLRHPGLLPETSGDQPLAHSQFVSWEHGCEAFAQHLRMYVGCPPTGVLIVNPRGVFVQGKYQVETFEELSQKWADPGVGYGENVVAIANKLIGA